jgi:GMP synthase-like glutamine amidotransferase
MKKILVFQHINREHPSNIALYAKERGIGLDVVRICDRESIPQVSNYDALIIMGGSMGVYEEYAGKEEEINAIQQALTEIPVLGICLGAQLLAHALGSRVYPMMKGGKRFKEIGYETVALTDSGKESSFFKGFDSSFTVLQWHGDTFDLPKGAALLATSDECTNQAFSLGKSLGVQFHFEVTPTVVAEWVAEDNTWSHTDFDMDDQKVVNDSYAHESHMKKQCDTMLDNFLDA